MSTSPLSKRKSKDDALSSKNSDTLHSRLRKKHGLRPSFLKSHSPESHSPTSEPPSPVESHSARPTLLRKGRPPSLFGSLKSRNEDDTPPATAVSSKAPSLNWKEAFSTNNEYTDIGKNRTVLHHGESQTNSTMFWKRKEYLVLTETHLIRLKSQSKASEIFHSIPSSYTRAAISRHQSSPSIGSRHESQSSALSDNSGEKIAGIPLEDIVAVYFPDESARPLHSLELAYLDNEAGQGSVLNLQFAEQDELELWAKSIRRYARLASALNTDPISARLSEYAARWVEREHDYDISNYRIFKVVKRAHGKSISRASDDDFSKMVSSICFLVIGVRKVHLILLPKNTRVSTPSLQELNDGGSFGIMAMTAIQVKTTDDGFSLTFRQPLERPRSFQLASLASMEIAIRLRHAENTLRPDWIQRPYLFDVAVVDEEQYSPDEQPEVDGLEVFDRTLIAYCVAYGIDSSAIRYAYNYAVEDSPRFELLSPGHGHPVGYSARELLAILRSLRYSECFGSISFAGISLDTLNGRRDTYGTEHICTQPVHGKSIRLPVTEQREATMLVQEIRAIAISSRTLRRLDFSHCITNASQHKIASEQPQVQSCGIIEAFHPLCKRQLTNVDWIVLNGIELQEIDDDYLIAIAAEKTAHFRAIEASGCGLTERGMSVYLNTFKNQASTLEALILSNNRFKLAPDMLSRDLGVFGYIRKLDFSNLATTGANEALLPVELLSQWRLEDLRLCGVPLNRPTVAALCAYLAHPQSEVLKEVALSNCSLTGGDAAALMHSMMQDRGYARYMHLDISGNRLQEKLRILTDAIRRGLSPTHVSMHSIEYDSDELFEELLIAFAANNSTRFLDISRAILPMELRVETCRALERLLSENCTIEDLDISGEDSRLEVSNLGAGINEALRGLKRNKTLQILKVQHQKLGLTGATTLADILRDNTSLRQLFCDRNEINLSGVTELVNALSNNYTLLHLPNLGEGRLEASLETERQIKLARANPAVLPKNNSGSKVSSMSRKLANFSLGSSSNVSVVGSGNSRAAPRIPALSQWTNQDLQHALTIINDSWEDQIKRLEVYLDRNWKVFNGLGADEMLSASSPQRPGTAGSIGQILTKVADDRTPTLERQTQLGDGHMTESASELELDERSTHSNSSLGSVQIDTSSLMKENLFDLAQDKLASDEKL